MILITTQKELTQLCTEIKASEVIGIDTEFMRRTTYYPCLSLVQMITPKHQAIIDVLQVGNLDPLGDILMDENITKIFHSPREDLDVFYGLFKALPRNIFDTQLAAQVCGFGASLSYGDLCKQLLEVAIDKKHQTSNWLTRPLPQEMLEYAISDVIHLPALYDKLKAALGTEGAREAYTKKINALLSESLYRHDLSVSWTRIKFTDRSSEFIAKIQVMAAFREECAMQINIPRRHVVSDEDLIKICQHLPHDEGALKRLKLRKSPILLEPYKTKLLELCAGLGC